MIKTLSLLLALVILPSSVQAQESQIYDPTFTGIGTRASDAARDAERRSLGAQGFITPTQVDVSIVHEPYMDDGQFGLLMAVPDVVNGCFELTPLEYEAKFIDPYYLDITVKRYRRIAPENGAPEKDCSGNKMSTAMMVLSREDLLKRGTNQIRFSTAAGRDTYDLAIKDSMAEIIPKSMTVFQAQGLTGPLKDRLIYTFTGDRVISLQVPMAELDDDVRGTLMAFAQKHALTPLDDQMMKGSGKGKNIFYFYDTAGKMAPQIGSDGYAEVGTIQVNRPFDGPNGRSFVAVDLDVFATHPGMKL